MVAYTLIMCSKDQITFELSNLQDQHSLTLCWRLLSEGGRECVTLTFAYKASQYLIDVWPQQITTQITDDARPTIVKAPLEYILP